MKKHYIFVSMLFLLVSSCNSDPVEPDYGDWPSSSNTGLTDPDNLTIVNNDTTIGTSGAIVENLDVRGTLTIQADNVTVRNCRVWLGAYYGIVIESGYKGILIEDCEIGRDYVNSSKGILIRSADSTEVTIQRCYIHHVGDGIFGGSNGGDPAPKCKITVQDCYITDIRETDGDDNVETIDDHKGDGMEFLGQIREAIILHNNIQVPTDQTSCLLFECNWGNLQNVTIENNLLNGAGYTVYTRIREGRTFEGLAFIDNHFGRDYNYGIWSNDVDTAEITAYGNIWYDTGEPVPGMLGMDE
ncbi:MAG: right-handed parallel beta-helix repeat-containing protein [candidate division WOR-3 bacterium]|jgi:hypothetical protein